MQNILHAVASAFFTGLLAIGSLFSPAVAPVGATIPVSVAVFQTSLASAVTSSATSMTLVNGTNAAGNTLSGYTCFNLDEGTSLEEFVCGTASGTSVTSMIRGIDPVDGDLEVTALKKGHKRGASVKVTDYPSIAILSRVLNGDETLPNAIKYASGVAPSTADDLTDKGYVDGVAIAGGADASTTVKGLAKLSTAPVSGTNPIAVGDNDTRVPTINTSSLTTGHLSALPGNNTDIAVGTGNKYITQTGIQKNAESYAVSATGNDTYVVTLSPVPTSLVNGMVVRVKPDTANTGAATLNVNSLGALAIVTGLSTPLVTGDILANQVFEVIYNSTGTVWQLTNPASVILSATVYKNGNITRDLGTASGAVTTAHGLGKTPKKAKFTAVYTGTGAEAPAQSFGTYNGTTTSTIWIEYDNNGDLIKYGEDTTNAVAIIYGSSSTDSQKAVATFDATNITLTWTKAGSGSGSIYIMWEVEG